MARIKALLGYAIARMLMPMAPLPQWQLPRWLLLTIHVLLWLWLLRSFRAVLLSLGF